MTAAFYLWHWPRPKNAEAPVDLPRPSGMPAKDDLLSTITRHIEEAQRMVSEQRGRIARLTASGTDKSLAEDTRGVCKFDQRCDDG